LPVAEIERVVLDQIRGVADDPGLRAEILRQAEAQFQHDLDEFLTERRGLERELSWHQADIRKLCGEVPERAANRLAELHDRVAVTESRLQELRQQVEQHQHHKLGATDVDAAFADFDNVWKALSPREQSQVLGLLVTRVEFDAANSTVAISFHPSAIRSLVLRKQGEAA